MSIQIFENGIWRDAKNQNRLIDGCNCHGFGHEKPITVNKSSYPETRYPLNIIAEESA